VAVKPYYERDGITLYHGDCREVLAEVQDVGLVLTDPPYGIAHPTNYHTVGRDALAPCRDWGEQITGDAEPFDPSPFLRWPCILWGANYYASRLPESSGWLVWDKLRPHDLDQATCEMAWTNFVKGARVFRHLWHGMIRGSEKSELLHPMQKPLVRMEWCLSLKWTPPGLVLDPYCGSGPVLEAAHKLGRSAIGIEIEERWCEVAARRLDQGVLALEPR
jgi:DNA modification methylase